MENRMNKKKPSIKNFQKDSEHLFDLRYGNIRKVPN